MLARYNLLLVDPALFNYGSVKGPIKLGKRKQKLYVSKVRNKILQGLHEYMSSMFSFTG